MRTTARMTGAATAAAMAALLMGGCGSSDDGGAGGESESAPASEETKAAPDDEGGGEVDAASLAGGWMTEGLHVDKGLLILTVDKDTAVLIGKITCTGRLAADAQPVTFTLKCPDGSTDYANGAVESLEGETLKVSWASGKKSTFTKTKPPSGLPTGADDIPTDPGELTG